MYPFRCYSVVKQERKCSFVYLQLEYVVESYCNLGYYSERATSVLNWDLNPGSLSLETKASLADLMKLDKYD